ncbi:hypothetical protein FQR65_LT01179 [Abscondita terminalis]|nr:hypothetical protein FQR65_LT01179 [Abscondita terminalis]
MSSSNTPKRVIATPLRLNKRQHTKLPAQTPECFTKVTVETPSSSKFSLISNDKCDEARNLVVAVRVRPMNARELSIVGAKNAITVDNNKLTINTSCLGSSTKLNYTFPYDHVFWSCDNSNQNYSSQEEVFAKIGNPLLENAFKGYNACLFAYGQTGSGKSYSMMGLNSHNLDCNDIGIIPRFCKNLFTKINQFEDPNSAIVDVSYFEIYNEKIHDLLLNNSNRTPLKVREHPAWGPYVVNLSSHKVKSYEELKSWLLIGNKNRAVAATLMNEKSSRSHSIFSIELSMFEENDKENVTRRSKISLVDLAGSERLGNSSNGSNEEKLKQGVFINKSLLTLGKVICALAEQKKVVQFVPYRESVLTWLLRESLGGNSFTSMLATITPANVHVDETLATLRYACQARSIVNRAHVNEDPHDRIIRELRVEVERLQALRQDYEKQSLSSSNLHIDSLVDYEHELEQLRNQLTNKETELEEAKRIWENRYKEHQLHQINQLAEVEKKKEELESQIRVMSNTQKELKLSPYRSNFLEEVENILTLSTSKEELLDKFEVWLRNCGYNYSITISQCGKYATILDNITLQKGSCPLSEIEKVTLKGDVQDFQHFLDNLNWNHDDCGADLDVSSVMSYIYNAAKILQPHVIISIMLISRFTRDLIVNRNIVRPLCSKLSRKNDEPQLEVRNITKDRTQVVPVETSIRYLQSSAFKQTYGGKPVWLLYRRNHKGSIPPQKTRRTCIRGGQVATGNPCPICRDEYLILHELNVDLLKQFICPYTGSILNYSKTGLCQKKHEELQVMIERAWDRGLLTFEVPFRKYDYSEYYQKKEAASLSEIHPNITVLHDSIICINTIDNIITTKSNKKIEFEYLCICTGGRPKIIPQAEGNQYVLGIRDTDSVDEFVERLSKCTTIAVVGNGGIASEIIYKIRNVEVHWIVKDKHITATFVEPGAATFFQDCLKSKIDDDPCTPSKRMRYKEDGSHKSGAALGPDWYKNLEIHGAASLPSNIKIHFETEVAAIKSPENEDQHHVQLHLTNKEIISCDLIVSATGVVPETSFSTIGDHVQTSDDGGISVNEFLQTSSSNIYAAGDVCTPNWDFAKHWFPMKLWTQARQMGCYAAKCMSAHSRKEEILQDFCFELFAHSTKLFGFKVILLGLYNGQKLGQDYEIMLRTTKGHEYIKFIIQNHRLQGAILIGETDLEETCENLILNQIDLSPYGTDILNPDIDIEDYFD